MKTKRLSGIICAICVAAMFSHSAFAADTVLSNKEATVMAALQKQYPKTVFKSVTASPLPGIFEVIMGKNVAYVEESGKYFLFGHMFDMHTQTDLTAEKIQMERVGKIDFDALPRDDAVVIVRGNGSRKMAVFSDPECPYCRQLEVNLTELTDVTIYLYLFPIAQLHPEAKAKTVGVWCAKDRVRAWEDLMRRGEVPSGQCDHPIDRNVALAESLGINGTPTIVLPDGTIVPGSMPLAKLEQQLNTFTTASKK
jgi:thiol:disulfide interchange protein DsbC